MDRGEKTKEQISALADGELDATQVKRLIQNMSDPELHAAWGRYHLIGDLIRSDDAAAPISAGFSTRFAERLAAEPPLLAPKRSLIARWGAWPTALAAVAAASFGFFIAPAMVGDKAFPAAAPSQLAATERVSHVPVLAEASGTKAVARAGVADYIRLHRSANPALYGAVPLSVPTGSGDSGER